MLSPPAPQRKAGAGTGKAVTVAAAAKVASSSSSLPSSTTTLPSSIPRNASTTSNPASSSPTTQAALSSSIPRSIRKPATTNIPTFSGTPASSSAFTASSKHRRPAGRPGPVHTSASRSFSSSTVPSSGSGGYRPSADASALTGSSSRARPFSMAASGSFSTGGADDATAESSLTTSLSSGHLHMKRSSTPRTASPPPTRTSSLAAGTNTTPASHVQAIHDFDPSIMPTAALTHNMYLSFRGGEVIRVHGRDASGWWDGEVTGTNGQVRRGWFPSNYVREVDWDELYGKSPVPVFESSRTPLAAIDTRSRHTSVHSHTSHGSHLSGSHLSHQSYQSSQRSSSSQLPTPTSSHTPTGSDPSNPFGPPPNLSPGLHALFLPIVQSLTLLQTSIQDGNLGHIQPSTAAVISAIRIALVRMDCMGRDSTVLSANPILSKERRYVLAELSKLVACAKLTADPNPEGDSASALESTGRAARSVFNWVRRFILHASDAGVTVLTFDQEMDANRNQIEAGNRVRSPSVSSTRPQPEALRLKSASINDLRGAARRQGSTPPMPSSAGPTTTVRPGSRASQMVSTSLGGSSNSGRSSPISMRPRRRGSSTRRHTRSASLEQYGLLLTDSPDLDMGSEMSHGGRQSSLDHDVIREFTSAYAVHEAIAAAEDGLLSIIASFIGHIHSHHIDSHPSSHAYLIELTRETVDRVRDLLTIVESVGRQAGTLGVHLTEVESLRSSRAELYHATTRLVEGAEAVANAPFAEGGEEAYDIEKAELLQVTTTTLRAGTECARVVRQCVADDPSDSDYDSPSLSGSNGILSPRLSRYSGVGLGIRGQNPLSRRATSLGQLHRRYHQDAGVHARSSSQPRRSGMDDDDEEIVADVSGDEDEGDETPEGRKGGRPTSHPPVRLSIDIGLDNRRRSSDVTVIGHRSRSTSLSVPERHKSPSLQADLDKEQGETTSSTSRLSVFSSQSHQSTQRTPSSELQGTPALSDAPLEQTDAEGGTSVELQSPVGGPPSLRPPVPGQSPVSGEDGGEMRFWVVTHDYDPREVAFNSEGTLVGGTLRVLVEKMTPHDGMPDANFAAAFWYTFRLFCTPTDLVDTLTSRFELKPPPVVEGMDQTQLDVWKERKLMPVRLRVYNFIKSWLDQHWRPEADDVVLDKLEAFGRDVVAVTMPAGMGNRLIEQVRRKQAPQSAVSESSHNSSTKSFERMRHSTLSGMLHAPPPASQVPTPVISKALHAQLMRNPAVTVISILDFDALELARQLTIMESKLFAAVAPEDLLMTGKKSVPELKALSTLSNQITGWVADGILNEQDAKHRAALLKFYIKLADKCLSLNNFSTLFAVIAGLNSSTILRLKKTWDVLSTKYRLLMDRLKGVIEHTKNHQAYRTRLRETTGPCLPFLGLILSDITFTQDGNPNTRPSTLSPELLLINQDKYTKLGRIASDFRRYQMPFDLKELEPVQQYLQRVLAERGSGSLEALYRKSLLLEPRQGSERLSSAVEKPNWLGARLQERVL